MNADNTHRERTRGVEEKVVTGMEREMEDSGFGRQDATATVYRMLLHPPHLEDSQRTTNFMVSFSGRCWRGCARRRPLNLAYRPIL
jgi:hypothetical protein